MPGSLRPRRGRRRPPGRRGPETAEPRRSGSPRHGSPHGRAGQPLLTHLPVDISFVDENDTVVYYSATPERIFPRSPGVIGRKVQNCHPPKSLDVVERILKAFRAGERDVAEFWIESHGRFIHIRYFALRDRRGPTGAARGQPGRDGGPAPPGGEAPPRLGRRRNGVE